MKLYKLTTQDNKTRKWEYNETTWGENVTHMAVGAGNQLCSDDVIHAYTNPVLAVLLNPIHANITNPILWEAEGKICSQQPDKVGCKSLTTTKRIPLPEITKEATIRFAIACALTVYTETSFKKWSMGWLTNKDRSADAAAAAYAAAYAANAAYAAAANAAAYAAVAAAYAANAAAAYAAVAAYAADAAAAYAAGAATAYAASGKAIYELKLISIAKWAISNKPYPKKGF